MEKHVTKLVLPRTLALLMAASCVGTAETSAPDPESPAAPSNGQPSTTPTTTMPTNGSSTPAAMACKAPGPQAAAAPVRRLTRREYNNTVKDLLGDTTGPAKDFLVDAQPGSFENNAGSPVTALGAAQYAEAASTLALTTVSTRLKTVLPCSATTPDDACAAEFVKSFGKRAYRRPLTDAEQARLLGLYRNARTVLGESFNDGIRVVMQTMLQSTYFLNHIEQGVAGMAKDGLAPLSPYEMASRLSYFLWSSMPDATLFAAADAGKLSSPAEIEAQATRMLNDARAKAGVLYFFGQWLELDKLDKTDKSTTLFPNWSTMVRKFLRPEAEAFVNYAMWQGDSKLTTMFTTPTAFVNSTLAPYYGVPDPGMGDTLVKTALDPAQRSGFLTLLTTMSIRAYSDSTDPVHRGLFVRERLLCQQMPSPPADIEVMAPKVNPKLTTRERFAMHDADPYCAGCHTLMDPIGLGFEAYDPTGRFRTMEAGKAIDDSGAINGGGSIGGPFKGALELGKKLAGSPEARDCFTSKWLEYAVAVPTAELGCAVSQLSADLDAGGSDIKKLIVAITKSSPFRYRKTIRTEVCQ
jgi:hypothetical protein